MDEGEEEEEGQAKGNAGKEITRGKEKEVEAKSEGGK